VPEADPDVPPAHWQPHAVRLLATLNLRFAEGLLGIAAGFWRQRIAAAGH
jgi:hypothetical protein